MSQSSLIEASKQEPQDNITDWSLETFQNHYGNLHITKDDIYFYVHGVMHAPDWRETFAKDLRESLPRIPLAADFSAFRDAGEELMLLQMDYDSYPEYHQAQCLVDGKFDEGTAEDPEVYRIHDKMRWGKLNLPGMDSHTDDSDDKASSRGSSAQKFDKTRLIINPRCELVGIPLEAHDYKISGRSVLEWETDSLRRKEDKRSGITDDPNTCEQWADDPFELIRHLRRLINVALRAGKIIQNLPSSKNTLP